MDKPLKTLTPSRPEAIATPTVKSLVGAYLMARVLAESMREQVNAIYLDILTECPIYGDRDGGQILDPGHLYLCSNMSLVQDAWAEADRRERKAGLKPVGMLNSHCPALVAEHGLLKVEWEIIKTSGEKLGITNTKLLCAGGSKMRQKFIDLVVGLVISLPDFKSPLPA